MVSQKQNDHIGVTEGFRGPNVEELLVWVVPNSLGPISTDAIVVVRGSKSVFSRDTLVPTSCE